MKKIFLVLTIFSLAFTVPEDVVGTSFPKMECENYNSKSVKLPDLKSNKYTIIAMAFSNEAESGLRDWTLPLYNEFKEKTSDPTNPFDIAMDYEVDLYFIPNFSKVNQVMTKKEKEKIKSKSEEVLFNNLLFLTITKDQVAMLTYKGKKETYIYVINPKGEIAYTATGKFNEKVIDEIIDVVTE